MKNFVCGSFVDTMMSPIVSRALDFRNNASGVGLSPLYSATSGLLYQPQMIGEGDCGAIGGMKIGRRN
jgi:hypothetical protein